MKKQRNSLKNKKCSYFLNNKIDLEIGTEKFILLFNGCCFGFLEWRNGGRGNELVFGFCFVFLVLFLMKTIVLFQIRIISRFIKQFITNILFVFFEDRKSKFVHFENIENKMFCCQRKKMKKNRERRKHNFLFLFLVFFRFLINFYFKFEIFNYLFLKKIEGNFCVFFKRKKVLKTGKFYGEKCFGFFRFVPSVFLCFCGKLFL